MGPQRWGWDCGGGLEVGWRRRIRDWWNADQTEVIPGSETLGYKGCGGVGYCRWNMTDKPIHITNHSYIYILNLFHLQKKIHEIYKSIFTIKIEHDEFVGAFFNENVITVWKYVTHFQNRRYIKNPDVVIKMDACSECLKSIMHSVGILSTWKTFKSSPYQFHCMSEKELLSKVKQLK